MWKAFCLIALVAVVVAGWLFVSHEKDKKAVDDAILQIANSDPSKLASIEQGYTKARLKALSIRSTDMRNRALGDIAQLHQERKRALAEDERLRGEALALMKQQHGDLLSLQASRAKAEELASKIQFAKEASGVLAAVSNLFNEQRDSIVAEERRRAEEELARRLEAERVAQEEQQRAAELEAELEQQKIAAAQYQQRPSAPEPQDCCCKTKVDVGFFLTKWEYQYRRLSKSKCIDPTWLDPHAEGWCVPDSYCH
ncbi:MAG TPA: hypothetical protein VN493_16100 [Thermoanaerobaculia bacterium]|nr:hypothetical protein [Thermoanaerobaculia bacterium]